MHRESYITIINFINL